MEEKHDTPASSVPAASAVLDPSFAAPKEAFSRAIDWNRYSGGRYSLAAIEKDGVFHCLAARIVLEPRRPSSSSGWLFADQNGALLIRRGWLRSPEAHQVCDGLRADHVVVDGLELALQRTQPTTQYSWTHHERLDLGSEGLPWAASRLQGVGSTIFDVIGRDAYFPMERSLSAGKRPFSSWEKLWQFLGADSVGSRSSASFEFFAPIFARIVSADRSLRDGRVSASVEFHQKNVLENDMRLVFEADDPRVEPAVVPGVLWERDGDNPCKASAEVPDGVKQVTVTLVVRGESVDRRTLSIPCLAARIHAAIDPEARWLRGLLGGTDQKKVASDGFEAGVTALLSLAGLPTIHYGFKSGENFPDMVVIAGDNLMIVGECTTDVPNATKVQTLHARAERIRAAAAESGDRPMLARVLFTPSPASAIPEEITEVAKELSVSLGTRERIDELFEAAIRGEDGFAIWSIVLGWCGLPVTF